MNVNQIKEIKQHGYDVLRTLRCTNIKGYAYGLGFGFIFNSGEKRYKAHYTDTFYGYEMKRWTVMPLDVDNIYFSEPFYESRRRMLEQALNSKTFEVTIFD